MKPRSLPRLGHLILCSLLLFIVPVFAKPQAPLTTAIAPVENNSPQKRETAWGRLVSDALRQRAKSDLAIINAGSLTAGSLKKGAVNKAQIEALLAFPSDDVVVVPLQGSQIKAALELSLRAYPTGTPAFLDGSGWQGTFDPQKPIGQRLVSLKIDHKPLDANTTYQVAMPVSLAQGANGYFAAWNEPNPRSLHVSVLDAVSDFLQKHHTISPDENVRLQKAG